MGKPTTAFETAEHTVTVTKNPEVYRVDPGGHEIRLSLDAQHVPAQVLTPAFERAVTAWVIARGGRAMHLNGHRRSCAPEELDRPAAGPVKRLISIAPSNAEIVGALGATGLLVGVESSSDFPPEVLELPRLGPDLAVDMEALAALQPDLVLASLTVPGMERNIAGLDRLGVPMLVHAPLTLAQIEGDVRRVGHAIGYATAAARVVEAMQTQTAALRDGGRDRAPLPVYLEWWPKPMFTPGAKCWSNEMIELAGGYNVFRERERQSLEVSPQEVSQADPAVIFVSWCGVPTDKLNPQRVLQRDGLQDVTAVREGHVVPLDESLLGRPGPRVMEGIARMAEAISRARRL